MGSAPPEADANLQDRIAAGEEAAEDSFVARFQPGVLAMVRRHCRPGESVVEDLAQDVMESTLRALRAGAVRDGQSLPAYVRSTVVFTVQAHYRKRKRRGEDQPLPAASTDPIEHADPAASVERCRIARSVRELLAELPVARDREVLRRFYLLEEESAEICAALDIDLSHFHRVLYRARERLRALLSGAGLGEVG